MEGTDWIFLAIFLLLIGRIVVRRQRLVRLRDAWDENWTGNEAAAARAAAKVGDLEPLRALATRLRQESWGDRDAVLSSVAFDAPVEAARESALAHNDSLGWLIAGMAMISEAWRRRGNDRAENVDEAAWDPFHVLVGQAEQAVLHAAELDPHDPGPWTVSLTTAMALGLGIDETTRRFQEACARDPHNLSAHSSYIQAAAEKWSGDPDALRRWAATLGDGLPDGHPMHAYRICAAFERIMQVEMADNESAGTRVIRTENLRELADEAYARSFGHPDYRPSRKTPSVRIETLHFYLRCGRTDFAQAQYDAAVAERRLLP